MKSRILLVNDNPEVTSEIAKVFGSVFDLVTLESADSALEEIVDWQPNLVLIFREAFGATGFQIGKDLGDSGQVACPIVFITTTGKSDDEITALESGGADFVAYPFHAKVLKNRINTQLLIDQQAHQIRRLAIRDELTNLYNQDYFHEQLEREWSVGFRTHDVLSLITIEIDNLDFLAKAKGPAARNQVITEVARTINEMVKRPRDITARCDSGTGGKFYCLLPGTHTEGAGILAEKLRAAIETLGASSIASAAGGTFSASVGVATQTIFEDIEPDSLIRLTNQFLDEAKSLGGNTVCADKIEEF